MTVGLMSLFRNSEHRLGRYFEQVLQLQRELKDRGHDLHLVWVYGDCEDHTYDALRRFTLANKIDSTIIESNHGGPVYGSTEEPKRLKALSQVINDGLAGLTDPWDISGTRNSMIPAPHLDAVIYVESDLEWDASVWLNLLNEVEPGYDVVAPLIFAGKHFYDIWGYRYLNGERFSSAWTGGPNGDELFEVSSVGSGFVMRGEVARTCRIINDYALVGLCDTIRDMKYRIWVDPTERITHPA